MPMENVIEVRPAAGVCPHCGSANMAKVLREVNGAESWSIECAECGGGPMGTEHIARISYRKDVLKFIALGGQEE